MTKAELEAANAALHLEVEALRRSLDSTLDKRPLDTWIAKNDVGQPVCIPFDGETLHSVQVYTNEQGDKATGVIVSDDADTVFAAGLIPGEVVMEEIRWLRRGL